MTRGKTRAAWALATALAVGGGLAAADDAKKDEGKVVAADDFDGKLGLKWKPVRPDPEHVSLTKHPGKLTITTQRGSIHGQTADEEDLAKNIYLIDNPLPRDADFVVTACVVGFTPEANWNQAGLILYNDDDNYLKFGYEFGGPNGQVFVALSETAAQSTIKTVDDSEGGLDKYWVRLTRRGDVYEYAWSSDGKEFHVGGELTWGEGPPKRIGLLAKNGGTSDAPELEAQFDSFELRSPAPAP